MNRELYNETISNEPAYLDSLISELSTIKEEDSDARELLENIINNNIPEDTVKELVKDRLNLEFEIMLRRGKFLEAGNNGIVFYIDQSTTSKLTHTLLRQEKIEIGNTEEVAVKILKVYDIGKGEKEFNWQTQAYKAIEENQQNNADGQDTIAHIPKPLHMRDQTISPDIKEYLQQLGGHANSNVELILMEYIDGKDLATILYNRILESLGYDQEELEKLSFSNKQEIVANNLHFTQPQGKARDEGAREFERIKILNENLEKIKIHLRKKLGDEEVVFDPAIFEKIKNTITALHKNNIYHNDLHERNIMIGENGKVYIIDFGSADSTQLEGRPDDEAIIRNWKEFTISNETKKLEEKTKARDELEKIQHAVLKNERLISRYKIPLKKAIEHDIEGTGKKLLRQFKAFSITDDREAENVFILLQHIRDESETRTTSENNIRKFLQLLKKEKNISPSIKNKARYLEEIGFL